MYYLGRIVGAFFNQFFRFLFWNKKGQKILFIAVIFVIAVCFIKLGEVSAVEDVNDINYEVRSYYDGVVSNAILFIENNWNSLSDNQKSFFLNNQFQFYFYYGNADGSSYNNAVPTANATIYIARLSRSNNLSNWTITSNDYMAVTGYTMYDVSNVNRASMTYSNFNSFTTGNNVYIPLFIRTYTPQIWYDYVLAKTNDDIETITAILQDIKEEQQLINENLTNDDVSNVNADLPQDSAVDPTDSLWGDMFDQVRTAVTSTSVSPISITIPFIDYSTIIEPAIYSPMTRIKNSMRPLYDFIILSWWFGASMWIVKDIHKYLEQIKNGDITAKDTNIKTEVL